MEQTSESAGETPKRPQRTGYISGVIAHIPSGVKIHREDAIARRELLPKKGIFFWRHFDEEKAAASREKIVGALQERVAQEGGLWEDMQMPQEMFDRLTTAMDEEAFAKRFQATHWTEHNLLHGMIVMQSAWMAGKYLNVLIGQGKAQGKPYSDTELLAVAIAGLTHDFQRRRDVWESIGKKRQAEHMFRAGEKTPEILDKYFSFLPSLITSQGGSYENFVHMVQAIVTYHGEEPGEPAPEYNRLVELIRFADSNSLMRLFVSPNRLTSRTMAGAITSSRLLHGNYLSQTEIPELNSRETGVQDLFINMERMLDVEATRRMRGEVTGLFRHSKFRTISPDSQKRVYRELATELGLLTTSGTELRQTQNSQAA